MLKKTIFSLFLSAGVFFVAYSQVPGAVFDVQHYGFNIRLNDNDNVIKGKADITIKFLQRADSLNFDLVKQDSKGKGMMVSSVTEKGVQLKFLQKADFVTIKTSGRIGSKHTYTITYQGVPEDGLIISTNKFGHRTFFGDNWPNRAHNWIPCVDNIADKATVDFTVTAPDHYQVISNGSKISETTMPGGIKETHWKESAPLPTKVMVIGVANFAINHTGDVGKIPVYTYVFPENKDVGFGSYSVAKEILNYYINKFGPYAYEKLANVQSKTIFGGMENASCIFYFENSVGDKGIEELMAHEIAHQWFGDAASEKSFAHLWLSEGFATYMTNVYLENKYGEDILKQRMTEDRKTVFDFEKQRFTPVVDTAVRDNFMQLLNANSYQKGGWVLHMLRRKIGDDAFWNGVRSYYAKYDGGNANTGDLQAEMENASGQDLRQFFKQWLYTPGHVHLSVKWRYDPAEKAVDLEIGQIQNEVYECTLEVSINGEIHKVDIKDKFMTYQVPVTDAPASVVLDPNVNLLAEFELIKDN
ncbi:MAG TPA: M1 family metallopeptidase [Mucilaginibacter sp.]|jgi:aminopeptidase N|nr:M1 family metallopeptidase [Mucilaginibacter sp.]